MNKEVTYIVGMDQLTPEYIKIPVYPEKKVTKKSKKEIKIEVEE